MRNALYIALAVLPVFTSCAVLNSRQEGLPAQLCGNEKLADHPSLRDTRAQFSNISSTGPQIQSFTIQTYIHIVSSEGKEKLITNSSIIDQLRFLNNRFLPTGIQFNFVNVSRSTNTSWAYSTVRFLKCKLKVSSTRSFTVLSSFKALHSEARCIARVRLHQ
jgi:hypothetical protein